MKDGEIMLAILQSFWKWFNITPGQYAREDMFVDELEFPQFAELISTCEKLIKIGIFTDGIIDDILTIMAIDNEAEDILNVVVDTISDKDLKKFIALGVNHIQPNTRWQIAELIYRRRPVNAMEYLVILSKDNNAYVRKRALNCINYLKLS